MSHFSFARHTFSKGSSIVLFLIAAWMIGLVLGFFAGFCFGDTVVSCVTQALRQPGSFAAPLITVFPLLVSALIVSVLPVSVLYVLCIVRGAALAIILQALAVSFEGGVCLVAVLLLFSTLLYSPVLLWYWWRRLDLHMVHFFSDTIYCTAIGLLIGVIDLCFISPFLMDVFIF